MSARCRSRATRGCCGPEGPSPHRRAVAGRGDRGGRRGSASRQAVPIRHAVQRSVVWAVGGFPPLPHHAPGRVRQRGRRADRVLRRVVLRVSPRRPCRRAAVAVVVAHLFGGQYQVLLVVKQHSPDSHLNCGACRARPRRSRGRTPLSQRICLDVGVSRCRGESSGELLVLLLLHCVWCRLVLYRFDDGGVPVWGFHGAAHRCAVLRRCGLSRRAIVRRAGRAACCC